MNIHMVSGVTNFCTIKRERRNAAKRGRSDNPRMESCGLRATTGKQASSAKQNPHQWYRKRLSVLKKMCGRLHPVTGLQLPLLNSDLQRTQCRLTPRGLLPGNYNPPPKSQIARVVLTEASFSQVCVGGGGGHDARHGGATTTGPDATPRPSYLSKLVGGGAVGGGGGSSRGSGGGSGRGSGGRPARGEGGVGLGLRLGLGLGPGFQTTAIILTSCHIDSVQL